MLSDRWLSVLSACLSVLYCAVLSVTLVYFGKTVGRIKMKLGTQEAFALATLCSMGTQLPFPKGAELPPQKKFSAHICSGQMAGWIKMPHGREVALGPSDNVLDEDPAPLPKKGAEPPIFDPCLLWPNGSMDQDGTWHGGGPRSRLHCARWGPSFPSQKGGTAPNFRSMSIVTKRWMDQDATWYGGRPRPGHIVLDENPAPPPKRGTVP